MADPCDLCGGEAKSYGPRGRRCLACLAADDPALRSDVPAVRHEIAWHRLDADGQPFCAPPCPAAPALRSDEPVSRDPVRPCVDCGAMGQWGPFTCCDPCWDKAHPKAPDIDVRPPPLPIGEPERRLWRQRVAVALILQVEAERRLGNMRAEGDCEDGDHAHLSRVAREAEASADAAHAALDAVMVRLVEVERILEHWPADGAVALRVLRGEPIVRERP